MALTSRHPLDELKQELPACDAARLADMLRGRGLPALGGDQQPADLIIAAFSRAPYTIELPQRLAGLAAELVAQAAEAERGNGSYLSNLFLLAAHLPRHDGLFDALVGYGEVGVGETGRLLRQARTTQQTDDRLEATWLNLMESLVPPPGRGYSREQQSEFLELWRGLLWIPPANEAAPPLSLDRAERGLAVLTTALADRPEGSLLLPHAIRMLDEAYPRSDEFWSDSFAAGLDCRPAALRDALLSVWPFLAEKETLEISGVRSLALGDWLAVALENVADRMERAGSAVEFVAMLEENRAVWEKVRSSAGRFGWPVPRRLMDFSLATSARARRGLTDVDVEVLISINRCTSAAILESGAALAQVQTRDVAAINHFVPVELVGGCDIAAIQNRVKSVWKENPGNRPLDVWWLLDQAERRAEVH